jgi:peptide/nickel transport system substrate-binding protein
VQAVNAPTMRVSYIQFDVNGKSGQDFFTKKKVREAFAHAVDREAIAKNLVGGASVVTHSACHPVQFGCSQDVPQWAYDPDLAKQKLTEAGYPDGFEFDLYAYRQREYTEAVIGDLAKIGIKANLKFMQYRALRDLVWKNETPVNHMTWGSNSIPDASAITSHFFSGGRDDFAKDPAVMKALETADNSTDPAVRRRSRPPTTRPIRRCARPSTRRRCPGSRASSIGCPCSPTPSTTSSPTISISRRHRTRSRGSTPPSGSNVRLRGQPGK